MKMTKEEKDSYNMFKKLVQKPKKLTPSDFVPGAIIMYVYDAKDKTKAYDGRPLSLILGRSSTHTLGLNFNWCPPKLREKILDGLMKRNKSNIKKGKPIVANYQMVKSLVRGLGPVIRLYINKRISPKGVVLPSYQYYKVITLRSEHFIGISAKSAWALAIAGYKAKKAKKKQQKQQRKKDATRAQARVNAKDQKDRKTKK